MNIRIVDQYNLVKAVKVDAVYYLRLPIIKIIKAGLILWSLITSCFGSGTWILTSNWEATDYWKNN